MQALEQLRSAIVTGVLEPGSMHSEQSIAAQLAISRTPIREALLQLSAEGFVEFIPQRGVKITRTNSKHLKEVFEYRIALDGYCAEALAKSPTREVLDALDRQLERQRAIIASGDSLEWVRANMDFHIIIAEATGNSVIADAMTAIASHTMRIGFQLLREKDRMVAAFSEHQAIVEAIREGRVDVARSLAMSHISITTANLKPDLEQLR